MKKVGDAYPEFPVFSVPASSPPAVGVPTAALDAIPTDSFERIDSGSGAPVPDAMPVVADSAAARKAHGLPSEDERQLHLADLHKATDAFAADPNDDAVYEHWLHARSFVIADLAQWTAYASELAARPGHGRSYAGAKARVESLALELGALEARAPAARTDQELIERASTIPLSLDDCRQYSSTAQILHAYHAAMTAPYKRPQGVSSHHFKMGVALRKSGISEAHVVALWRDGKESLEIGAAREKAARTGDRACARAIAGLIELRASSVRAQRQLESLALAAQMRALAAMADTDQRHASLTAAVAERQAAIAGLDKTLLVLKDAHRVTYREADARRYAIAKRDVLVGQAYLAQAEQLLQQANRADVGAKKALQLRSAAARKKKMGEAAIARGNPKLIAKGVEHAKRIDRLGDKASARLREQAGEAFAVAASGVAATVPDAPRQVAEGGVVVPGALGSEQERNAAAEALAAGHGLDSGGALPGAGETATVTALLGLSKRYGGKRNVHNDVTLDSRRKALAKIAGYERLGKQAVVKQVDDYRAQAERARDHGARWLESKEWQTGAENAQRFFAQARKLDVKAAKAEEAASAWANRYWAFAVAQNDDAKTTSSLVVTRAGGIDQLRGDALDRYTALQREIGAFSSEVARAHKQAQLAEETTKTAQADLTSAQEEETKVASKRHTLAASVDAAKVDLARIQAEPLTLDSAAMVERNKRLAAAESRLHRATKALSELDTQKDFHQRVAARAEDVKHVRADESSKRTDLVEATIRLESEKKAIASRWLRLSRIDRDLLPHVLGSADSMAIARITQADDTPSEALHKAVAQGERAFDNAQRGLDRELERLQARGGAKVRIGRLREDRLHGSGSYAQFLAATAALVERNGPPVDVSVDGHKLMSPHQRAKVAGDVVRSMATDLDALGPTHPRRDALLHAMTYAEATTAESFVVEAPRWATTTINSAKLHAAAIGEPTLRDAADLYVTASPARMLQSLRNNRRAIDRLDSYDGAATEELVSLGSQWVDQKVVEKVDAATYARYSELKARHARLEEHLHAHNIDELTQLIETPVGDRLTRKKQWDKVQQDIVLMREAAEIPKRVEQILTEAGHADLGQVARATTSFAILPVAAKHALFIDKFRREVGFNHVRQQLRLKRTEKENVIDDSHGGVVVWEWDDQDREMAGAEEKDSHWRWQLKTKRAQLDATSLEFERGLDTAMKHGHGFSFLLGADVIASREEDFDSTVWRTADQWVGRYSGADLGEQRLPQAMLNVLSHRGQAQSDLLKDAPSDFPGLVALLTAFDPGAAITAQDPRINRQMVALGYDVLEQVNKDFNATVERLRSQMIWHAVLESVLVTGPAFFLGAGFAAVRGTVRGGQLATEMAALGHRTWRGMGLVRALNALSEASASRLGSAGWRMAASLTESAQMQVTMLGVQKAVVAAFGERSTMAKLTQTGLNFWGFWHQPRIAGLSRGSVHMRGQALIRALAPQLGMNVAQTLAVQLLAPETHVGNIFLSAIIPAGVAGHGAARRWKQNHAEASRLVQAHVDAGASVTDTQRVSLEDKLASRLAAFQHHNVGKPANPAEVLTLRRDLDVLFGYDTLPEGEQAQARARSQAMVDVIVLDHSAALAANELGLDGQRNPSSEDVQQAVQRTAEAAIAAGVEPVKAYTQAAQLWIARFSLTQPVAEEPNRIRGLKDRLAKRANQMINTALGIPEFALLRDGTTPFPRSVQDWLKGRLLPVEVTDPEMARWLLIHRDGLIDTRHAEHGAYLADFAILQACSRHFNLAPHLRALMFAFDHAPRAVRQQLRSFLAREMSDPTLRLHRFVSALTRFDHHGLAEYPALLRIAGVAEPVARPTLPPAELTWGGKPATVAGYDHRRGRVLLDGPTRKEVSADALIRETPAFLNGRRVQYGGRNCWVKEVDGHGDAARISMVSAMGPLTVSLGDLLAHDAMLSDRVFLSRARQLEQLASDLIGEQQLDPASSHAKALIALASDERFVALREDSQEYALGLLARQTDETLRQTAMTLVTSESFALASPAEQRRRAWIAAGNHPAAERLRLDPKSRIPARVAESDPMAELKRVEVVTRATSTVDDYLFQEGRPAPQLLHPRARVVHSVRDIGGVRVDIYRSERAAANTPTIEQVTLALAKMPEAARSKIKRVEIIGERVEETTEGWAYESMPGVIHLAPFVRATDSGWVAEVPTQERVDQVVGHEVGHNETYAAATRVGGWERLLRALGMNNELPSEAAARDELAGRYQADQRLFGPVEAAAELWSLAKDVAATEYQAEIEGLNPEAYAVIAEMNASAAAVYDAPLLDTKTAAGEPERTLAALDVQGRRAKLRRFDGGEEVVRLDELILRNPELAVHLRVSHKDKSYEVDALDTSLGHFALREVRADGSEGPGRLVMSAHQLLQAAGATLPARLGVPTTSITSSLTRIAPSRPEAAVMLPGDRTGVPIAINALAFLPAATAAAIKREDKALRTLGLQTSIVLDREARTVWLVDTRQDPEGGHTRRFRAFDDKGLVTRSVEERVSNNGVRTVVFSQGGSATPDVTPYGSASAPADVPVRTGGGDDGSSPSNFHDPLAAARLAALHEHERRQWSEVRDAAEAISPQHAAFIERLFGFGWSLPRLDAFFRSHLEKADAAQLSSLWLEVLKQGTVPDHLAGGLSHGHDAKTGRLSLGTPAQVARMLRLVTGLPYASPTRVIGLNWTSLFEGRRLDHAIRDGHPMLLRLGAHDWAWVAQARVIVGGIEVLVVDSQGRARWLDRERLPVAFPNATEVYLPHEKHQTRPQLAEGEGLPTATLGDAETTQALALAEKWAKSDDPERVALADLVRSFNGVTIAPLVVRDRILQTPHALLRVVAGKGENVDTVTAELAQLPDAARQLPLVIVAPQATAQMRAALVRAAPKVVIAASVDDAKQLLLFQFFNPPGLRVNMLLDSAISPEHETAAQAWVDLALAERRVDTARFGRSRLEVRHTLWLIARRMFGAGYGEQMESLLASSLSPKGRADALSDLSRAHMAMTAEERFQYYASSTAQTTPPAETAAPRPAPLPPRNHFELRVPDQLKASLATSVVFDEQSKGWRLHRLTDGDKGVPFSLLPSAKLVRRRRDNKDQVGLALAEVMLPGADGKPHAHAVIWSPEQKGGIRVEPMGPAAVTTPQNGGDWHVEINGLSAVGVSQEVETKAAAAYTTLINNPKTRQLAWDLANIMHKVSSPEHQLALLRALTSDDDPVRGYNRLKEKHNEIVAGRLSPEQILRDLMFADLRQGEHQCIAACIVRQRVLMGDPAVDALKKDPSQLEAALASGHTRYGAASDEGLTPQQAAALHNEHVRPLSGQSVVVQPFSDTAVDKRAAVELLRSVFGRDIRRPDVQPQKEGLLLGYVDSKGSRHTVVVEARLRIGGKEVIRVWDPRKDEPVFIDLRDIEEGRHPDFVIEFINAPDHALVLNYAGTWPGGPPLSSQDRVAYTRAYTEPHLRLFLRQDVDPPGLVRQIIEYQKISHDVHPNAISYVEKASQRGGEALSKTLTIVQALGGRPPNPNQLLKLDAILRDFEPTSTRYSGIDDTARALAKEVAKLAESHAIQLPADIFVPPVHASLLEQLRTQIAERQPMLARFMAEEHVRAPSAEARAYREIERTAEADWSSAKDDAVRAGLLVNVFLRWAAQTPQNAKLLVPFSAMLADARRSGDFALIDGALAALQAGKPILLEKLRATVQKGTSLWPNERIDVLLRDPALHYPALRGIAAAHSEGQPVVADVLSRVALGERVPQGYWTVHCLIMRLGYERLPPAVHDRLSAFFRWAIEQPEGLRYLDLIAAKYQQDTTRGVAAALRLFEAQPNHLTVAGDPYRGESGVQQTPAFVAPTLLPADKPLHAVSPHMNPEVLRTVQEGAVRWHPSQAYVQDLLLTSFKEPTFILPEQDVRAFERIAHHYERGEPVLAEWFARRYLQTRDEHAQFFNRRKVSSEDMYHQLEQAGSDAIKPFLAWVVADPDRKRVLTTVYKLWLTDREMANDLISRILKQSDRQQQ